MSEYSSDYASYSSSSTVPPPEPIGLTSSSLSVSLLPSSSSASIYPMPDGRAAAAASSAGEYDASSPTEEFLPYPTEEDESQLQAIRTWTQRVKICAVAHMVTAIAVLRSDFYASTIAGCVLLLAFYAYAHFMRIRRKNFIYLFLLVVSLNLVRDGVILFFYIPALEKDWWGFMLLVLLGVDAVAVTPLTLYSCFYLHRSTAVSQLSV